MSKAICIVMIMWLALFAMGTWSQATEVREAKQYLLRSDSIKEEWKSYTYGLIKGAAYMHSDTCSVDVMFVADIIFDAVIEHELGEGGLDYELVVMEVVESACEDKPTTKRTY